MTLRQEMLQAAQSATKQLHDATPAVISFVESCMNSDGGFRGRSDGSDLYYTGFAVDALCALGAELPRDHLITYLSIFGGGDGLDFIHLASLARCRAAFPEQKHVEAHRRTMIEAIESHRRSDGGYAHEAGIEHGTAYGCFLAVAAIEDLQAEVQDINGVVDCLRGLRSKDGAWANVPNGVVGSTPATAAAVALLAHLGEHVDPEVEAWLLSRCRASGGFLAGPQAPLPDLLSTATALHALKSIGADLDPIKEPCLDFVDDLWHSNGSFQGHLADNETDCEYTFYGLLALGCLSR